jgi:hypothetical protein
MPQEFYLDLGMLCRRMTSLTRKNGSSLRKGKMYDAQKYLASRLNKMLILQGEIKEMQNKIERHTVKIMSILE